MPTLELPTTPNGQPIVDVLIDAYAATSFPNHFRTSQHERPDPLTPEGEVLRAKIGDIAFAPYWGARFQALGERPAGVTHSGMFAGKIFRAAETESGDELLRTVAVSLAEEFGKDVVEADVIAPEFGLIKPATEEIFGLKHGSVAGFLLDRREFMKIEDSEGRISNYRFDLERDRVSSSWIALTKALQELDPGKHEELLLEIRPSYNEADHESSATILSEEGAPYGYNRNNRMYDLARALAKPIATHFPELVVSGLVEPTKPTK